MNPDTEASPCLISDGQYLNINLTWLSQTCNTLGVGLCFELGLTLQSLSTFRVFHTGWKSPLSLGGSDGSPCLQQYQGWLGSQWPLFLMSCLFLLCFSLVDHCTNTLQAALQGLKAYRVFLFSLRVHYLKGHQEIRLVNGKNGGSWLISA